MSSRLVAVVGPSGAGKDTLMALACRVRPEIRAARRVITRPGDAGGEDFEGVDEAEFAARQQAGGFALHWRAHGLGYGIPTSALAGEGTVLFNASRAVLAQAQARFPDLTVVLVTAPSEVLARRLASRARESGDDQAARLARAGFPLPEGICPRVVMNDGTPEEGLARFLAALQPERV
ncbi:phosphonate metabolism protein/1,5-bisphosphokinase (PRPP-forming) PhnN (plasmid) [Paracoccus methylovorus]|uniref:Ribose 1,5-bisphosphate phosphokinase PhnN n=1 Tax=Paracoccus methylovorus TaxID=2812658 RepID=A0ABX7JMV6_9RHOB|nr:MULTISPECIES: phosphonate metabolism protein/1,5-bisphosphokinase (PRPP-forming) PhnN [Paracoccus]QRZ14583.1 phosphonate metabolism protein/1,5-bisphosphokinase (PRPP-forming) PhnN [Paracoccus methylovorus]